MGGDNFKLFDKTLVYLVETFFIFDQYNYARWLCVHIQDLLSFPITCPKLYREFENLWSKFQVASFHESILTNLTERQLSMN